MKKMSTTAMMQANGGAVYMYSYYAYDFNTWRLRRRDVYKAWTSSGRSYTYWVYAT